MPAPRLPLARGFPALDAEDVRRLGAGEVLVYDGVLGATCAAEIAKALCRADELSPAAVGRGDERHRNGAVRGDLTRWLERESVAPLARVWELFDRVRAELAEHAWLPTQECEVQLALYPPDGAAYVAHVDAFAGGGRRRATAVYYLNAEWRPGDGGELRVHEPAGPRDVAPVLDRLVLFLSERVEHEVLPAYAARWAVTAWLLGPVTG